MYNKTVVSWIAQGESGSSNGDDVGIDDRQTVRTAYKTTRTGETGKNETETNTTNETAPTEANETGSETNETPALEFEPDIRMKLLLEGDSIC